MSLVSDKGLEAAMRLLINRTDEKTEDLKTAYDAKFTEMQDVVNSVSGDVTKLSEYVDEQVDQMHQEVSGYSDILQNISQQISDLSTTLNNKIDSIKEDFDNLDTQVNTIAGDISNIKDAMGNMIVNIIPNEDGQFDVYHYDGTVNHNTMVTEIDPTQIDDILLGYDASGDNVEQQE